MPDQFKWPCQRREAHGPHPRTPMGLMASEDSETNASAYLNGEGGKTAEHMCPGVKAHPNTMIGREPSRRPVVNQETNGYHWIDDGSRRWDTAPRAQREDVGGE